jgi:hypothetical protein
MENSDHDNLHKKSFFPHKPKFLMSKEERENEGLEEKVEESSSSKHHDHHTFKIESLLPPKPHFLKSKEELYRENHERNTTDGTEDSVHTNDEETNKKKSSFFHLPPPPPFMRKEVEENEQKQVSSALHTNSDKILAQSKKLENENFILSIVFAVDAVIYFLFSTKLFLSIIISSFTGMPMYFCLLFTRLLI